MWFQISQFRVGLDEEETRLAELLAGFLGLPRDVIGELKIVRKSLDARHKQLAFIYSLVFEISGEVPSGLETILENNPNLTVFEPSSGEPEPIKKLKSSLRPVIVGAGPAGLFAGYQLARAGLRPIIIERGEGLAARLAKVKLFWKEGILDPESNIQFGIGGAGTFSDGKLTTRIKDERISEILQLMVDLGAPAEIRYWQSPHIGTDLLQELVINLTNRITDAGGELRFRECLTGLERVNERIVKITVNDSSALETDCLLLATGNSARDLYRLLAKIGLRLEAKPFAVGMRIEHPQELIDRAQYGKAAGHPRLKAADYRLTFQDRPSGRGVYTFCMCPGGFVIGAASKLNALVTNGMSFYARDSGVANSAIVVTVTEKDYGNGRPLAAMEFQEQLEQVAFRMGGGAYRAPAQRVGDFLNQRLTSEFRELTPSYRPGVKTANLWELFPGEISRALATGIKYFGTRLARFDWPEAVLTAVETRTSAPVRIIRDEQRQAIDWPGVYPVGEGAGYAGGIISSALDGWKTAEAIIDKLSR